MPSNDISRAQFISQLPSATVSASEEVRMVAAAPVCVLPVQLQKGGSILFPKVTEKVSLVESNHQDKKREHTDLLRPTTPCPHLWVTSVVSWLLGATQTESGQGWFLRGK